MSPCRTKQSVLVTKEGCILLHRIVYLIWSFSNPGYAAYRRLFFPIGFAQVILLLIFGFSIQGNAVEQHCKNLLDYTRLKAPSNTGAVDCEKYIECKDHKDIHKSCPDGYGYNDKTKGCSWSNEVCDSQTSSINDCTKDGEVFPNPMASECGSFYYCKLVAGSEPPLYTIESENCPTGEIFNPSGYDTYSGEGVKPCSAKDKYYCPTIDHIPDCHKIESGTYLPDPTNCYGYYYCYGGIRLKGKCDETKYHFDFSTKSCINITESSCKRMPPPSVGICKGKIGLNVADSEVCTAYYHCITEELPQHTFCQNGAFFNNYGYCDWNYNQPASSKCSCEKVLENQEINVKHNDTTKFWECKYDGERRERVLRTCFLGTTFNATAESCVFEDGVFKENAAILS